MNKYARGKIYKVTNDIDNEIYVGSTYNRLCVRMGSHRHRARIDNQRRLYAHMNAHGADHFRIVLIENFPCNNRDELRSREEYWRRTLGANLNMMVCKTDLTRSDYDRKYQRTHQHVRETWRKSKYQCDCGAIISKGNKQYHETTIAHTVHAFIWR